MTGHISSGMNTSRNREGAGIRAGAPATDQKFGFSKKPDFSTATDLLPDGRGP